MNEAPVHYFAFGANMARRVLEGRRGLRPLESRAAVLEGYALRFVQRGLPGIEPAFASVVEAPGERIHGVLYTLSAPDMRRLDAIERSYDRIPVRVNTARGEVLATAYRAKRPRTTEGMPSRRYLGLLIEGAKEHGLPETFIADLEARGGLHLPIVSVLVEVLVESGERGRDRIVRVLRGLRGGR